MHSFKECVKNRLLRSSKVDEKSVFWLSCGQRHWIVLWLFVAVTGKGVGIALSVGINTETELML